MLYASQKIDLDDGEALVVGFVMCVSAPTCQLLGQTRTEKGHDVRTLAALSKDQLAELITALATVHAQMPSDGP